MKKKNRNKRPAKPKSNLPRNRKVCRACAGAGWTGGTENGVDADGFAVVTEERRPCLVCNKTGFIKIEKPAKEKAK